MTKQEAGEKYNIPVSILDEYESWGLCHEVKKATGAYKRPETQDAEQTPQ